LENVTISDGVETIGDSAFIQTKLNSVVIPSSIKSIGGSAFYGCSTLTSVFYQGSTVLSAYSVFYACSKLKTMCVSPDYNATSFLDVAVTYDSQTCIDFQNYFNHCYEGTYIDGKVEQQKRRNATLYEGQSNACFERHCYNDVGRVSWSICNSTKTDIHICVDTICTTNLNDLRKTVVDIEIEEEAVRANETDFDETSQSLSVMSGVPEDNFTVGSVVSDDGYIMDLIVPVDNRDDAYVIADAIETLDKGEGCPEKYCVVVCRAKSVRVIVYEDLSTATTIHPLMMMTFVMVISFVLNIFY